MFQAAGQSTVGLLQPLSLDEAPSGHWLAHPQFPESLRDWQEMGMSVGPLPGHRVTNPPQLWGQSPPKVVLAKPMFANSRPCSIKKSREARHCGQGQESWQGQQDGGCTILWALGSLGQCPWWGPRLPFLSPLHLCLAVQGLGNLRGEAFGSHPSQVMAREKDSHSPASERPRSSLKYLQDKKDPTSPPLGHSCPNLAPTPGVV